MRWIVEASKRSVAYSSVATIPRGPSVRKSERSNLAVSTVGTRGRRRRPGSPASSRGAVSRV